MLKVVRNQLIFLSQFGRRYETTGSIIASSRFLAKAVTRYLAQRYEHPVCVLECGPGTGPFTDDIVRHLRRGDRFDLVELNEAFVDVLRGRFETEAPWQAVKDITQIHQCPLQEFRAEQSYDFIISGLPLLNFRADVVETIMQTYFRLLKPGGMLSYFEYMYMRPVRRSLPWGSGARRVREVNAVLQKHFRESRIGTDTVLLNVPPAWVQHFQSQLE